jgi:hypothetical protein
MLIVLQFPICDVRRFVGGENGCLPRPNWWLARADKDFVRSIGLIRKRRMGGLDNWIGEHKVCVADNALRFEVTPDAIAFFRQPGWKIAFRTLYFDGCCVGKFEVAVSFAGGSGMAAPKLKETLRRLLNLPVRVPTSAGDRFERCRLADAGTPLAALFGRVSTDQHWPDKATVPDWWVSAQCPVLLVEQRFGEGVPIDLPCDKSFPAREGVPAIDHHRVTRQGKDYGVWAYREGETATSRQEARRLRIALLRIHAEREVLVNVLRLAAEKKLDANLTRTEPECAVAPGPDIELDDPSAQRNCANIQAYLNAATRRIGKLEKRMGVPIETLANELDDAVNEGEREAIRAAIDGIRGNVKRKVTALMDRPSQRSEAPRAKLTGAQIGLLRDALLDAFDRAALTQVVTIYLDEELEAVVKDDALKNMVFELIRWAERMGCTEKLIAGACAENPGHAGLREAAKKLQRVTVTGGCKGGDSHSGDTRQ